MTDAAEFDLAKLATAAVDVHGLNANELRAMGIDHELLPNDNELLAIVTVLLELGLELEDLVDEDLTFLAAPRMIRPDATIHPRDAFGASIASADFRAKAAVALGFNIDDETRLLTPDEVETIEFFAGMCELIGEDDMLAILRVLGSAMGRVSRSVISSLRVHYETPILEGSGSLAEVFSAYRDLTGAMLTPFLSAAATVLRRHVAVAAATPTVWSVDGNRTATTERVTVGFVDLVGFTSFTEKANLKQFIDALTSFESQVQEAIVTNGGTLIKLIGDEAMFVAPTPASGIEIARQLCSLVLDETGPASVRIGVACGEVVAVGGDYYGTVVNIASRAVDEAEPDTIVVTTAVTNGAHASTRFEDLGPHRLRGISEPVNLYRLL